MAEVVVVPGPVELVEAAAPAGLQVVGRGPVVAPGPTAVFRDPVAPEASTAARPDQLAAGAVVPPAGWVVPHWIVPWRDPLPDPAGLAPSAPTVPAALEHPDSTVRVGWDRRGFPDPAVWERLASTGLVALEPLESTVQAG